MGSRRSVNIAGLMIGGSAPVRVESMLKTSLADMPGCLTELDELVLHGCELVRVSLPEARFGSNLKRLVERSPVPLMADIHFNYKLALKALEAGCPSIRINPGNMSGGVGLSEVLVAAVERCAVVRIGANGGSLSNGQLTATRGDIAAALAAAVEEQVSLLRDNGFEDIIISAKSSDVLETVRANTLLAQKYDYPLHIGITEAGPGLSGAVKGAAGISLMLAQGIGDTIRVSLTAPGIDEVKTGYHILRSLRLRGRGVNLISCPTCGRKRVDVIGLVQMVEKLLPQDLPEDFSVAVMGCEVNGPKEAAGADLGIAGAADGLIIFRKGKPFANGTLETLPELLKAALKEQLRPKTQNHYIF